MTSLQRSFQYAFLALLASIVFSIAAAQILYAIVLVLWIAVAVRERKFEFTTFDLVVTAFFLVRIVSIIVSEYPSASALALYREVALYPFYYIAASYIRTYELPGIKTALRVLLYSAAVPALYAVVTVAAHMVDRGASFSGGYYSFSIHLGFVMAFAMVLILDETERRRKTMLFALLALVSVALLVTYTRSMWIAAGLAFLLFGLLAYRKWMIPAVLVLALAIGLTPSLRERAETLVTPAQHSSGRLEMWNVALAKIAVHPFLGFGPETFIPVFGDRSWLPDPNVASWHNELLQVQIESGAGALCLLLLLYGTPVWMAIALARKPGGRDRAFMRNFAMFSFIVIVPSILFGIIMMSILNGLLLKFVLAAYSFIGARENLWKVYRPGRAA